MVRSTSRDWLGIGGAALAVAVIGLAAAYRFVDPPPPTRVVFSGGEQGGAYAKFAEKYASVLARHGVQLDVEDSAGSLQNVERLLAGEADVALIQGGTAPDDGAGLLSLGATFFEPVWLFYRGIEAPGRLSEIRGLRVAVGPDGSGTRAIALRLLEANGLTKPPTRLVSVGSTEAAAQLRSGDIDAAFFVASPDSEVVGQLLHTDGIGLMSFERAAAYSRTHGFLSELLLPEGTLDLAANLPPRDTHLIAPAASLVVREGFHPALIDLLLEAAAEIHGSAALFAEPGQFPSDDHSEIALSPDARRFFEFGPSFLRRYLPFWAATQIDRLKVMLLPLVALLLPLARTIAPLYRWRVRSRIYRWYRELGEVDPESDQAEGIDDRMRALERIEDEVRKVDTPPSYAEELYHLRLHLELVRRKLEELAGTRG